MTNNEREIELLNSNPSALIVEYQSLIEIVVGRFIGSGAIDYSNKSEFIQIINERLLLSSERIRKQYKGISLLKTYFSTIIRNICLEEIKNSRRHTFYEFAAKYENEISEKIDEEPNYVQYEFDRLRKVLKLFNSKAAKLVLCIKIIYRLPITTLDVKNYSLKISTEDARKLIDEVHQELMIPEYELFEIITKYFNKYEQQDNKSDALRRWMKRKMEEVIILMNGDPPRANYDKESMQILMEKYFSRKESKLCPNNDRKSIKVKNPSQKWF